MGRRKIKNTIDSWGINAPLIALALVACGGGGGGSSNSNSGGGGSQPARTSFSGRVYDGPIMGAPVYVDVNSNGQVDSSDLMIDTTDAQGRYSGTVQGSHRDKPLLVDLSGTADIDVGEDGVAGTSDDERHDGVWRAPAGSQVISPFTNLIANDDFNDMIQELVLSLTPEEIEQVTGYDPFDENGRVDPDDLFATAFLAIARELAVAFGANPDDITTFYDLPTMIREDHDVANTMVYDTMHDVGDDQMPLVLTLTSGYKDNALFVIRNGDIYWADANSRPDFENPADENGDNIYEVQVQTSIGVGGSETLYGRLFFVIEDLANDAGDPTPEVI